MSAEGSSVKGSNQQSSTSFPKVKGGDPLFSGLGPLIMGELVNDTTPVWNPTALNFLNILQLSENLTNLYVGGSLDGWQALLRGILFCPCHPPPGYCD